MGTKGLTVGLNVAWQIAAQEASVAGYQYIEKEHMFIGLCSLGKVATYAQEREGTSPEVLEAIQAEENAIEAVLNSFKLDSTSIRRQTRQRIGQHSYRNSEGVIHRSEDCKQVFDRAAALAEKSPETSCLHFMAALMENPGGIISEFLKKNSVAPSDLAQNALKQAQEQKIPCLEGSTNQENVSKTGTPYLDKYGRDLTKEAQQGKLGPFIGRRNELLLLIQTLARKTKSNPVLVGESGVGKTAIVEALAVRIAEGKDTTVLEKKRIVELNLGNLVAGTNLRGDFERRLSGIIEEARTHPEVIVFIDEIHNTVGAGRGEGALDAANILKPALARGDIRCIGATTITEYRRYIEQDPALERRFEKIVVSEPTAQETVEILQGLKPKLEAHHHVGISDSAIVEAVNLSVRFDNDHQLPDKAIDLVDKAAARLRVPTLSLGSDAHEKIRKGNADVPQVTKLTIAQVLAEKTGIAIEVITSNLDGSYGNRLLGLEEALRRKIIGQDEALNQVYQRLLLAHSGLDKHRGPLAVFMFMGPTGVGKTETAKQLADFLFGNQSNIIRLDMSEFMEEHSVAKLLGSPPGYIGYEAEGQLTGKLRTHPYSVVLLDEIEKAHPRVLDLFLQVFDDGRLTDAKGRFVDAKNAIFIMTSNLRMDDVKETPQFYGVKNNKTESIRERLSQYMRPELVNRIDEIVEFKALGKASVEQLVHPILEEICLNVKRQHGVTLQATEDAVAFIANAGYSSSYGVRELDRTIERLISIPLSRLILSGDLKKSPIWQIGCSSQEISILPFTKKSPYETEPV